MGQKEQGGRGSDSFLRRCVVECPQEGMNVKGIWKDMATALFMGMILPGIALQMVSACRDGRLQRERAEETIMETVEAETLPTPVALTAKVRWETGETEKVDMDAYLLGVVLAEMPVSFEMEALKAQAVVARTYTRKAYVTDGKHGDGSVCTDPGCCQAYISEEAYLAQGGTREGVDKVRFAIGATTGYVLTYGEELIEATYFSCSGGSTEDAAAVWGTDYPYLQAVASPGEEDAPHDTDTVTFTPEEFQKALGAIIDGSPRSWIGTVTYTEGGGVATMVIGGETYTGIQLRTLLGLRSTAFTVLTEEEEITITTRGYGHRVGMSQYGADAMAVTGSTYQEILAHYYPGAELTKLGG